MQQLEEERLRIERELMELRQRGLPFPFLLRFFIDVNTNTNNRC